MKKKIKLGRLTRGGAWRLCCPDLELAKIQYTAGSKGMAENVWLYSTGERLGSGISLGQLTNNLDGPGIVPIS